MAGRRARARDERGAASVAQVVLIQLLAADPALAQANEPLRVYLSCFRALRACQDERANDLLVAAYKLMQERAAKMPDTASRQAFFENVPSNSILIREFEASKLLMVRS